MTQQEKFSLGAVLSTPAALEALSRSGQAPQEFLGRYAAGDWGHVPHHDWVQNELACITGGRILAAYKTNNADVIWIITEADRSTTTILLPEEY